MKKISLIILLILFVSTNFFAAIFDEPKISVSSQKLMPKSWWGYDALMTLAMEQNRVFFTQDAPISVGEIKRYMEELDYNSLSPSSQKLYDDICYDFYQSGLVFKSDSIKLGIGFALTPEFYYKSNPDVPWSHNYYLQDEILTAPVSFAVGDVALIQSDIFFGKNYWAYKEDNNFTNLPLGYNDMEFFWPRTSYLSMGFKVNGKETISFKLGRAPLSFGQSQTGSIILSENFEADGFAQLSFFSPSLKYVLTTIQSDVNRYFYLHRIEGRFFKRIQFSVVEGAFINAPFEFRFLNPLCIVHSFCTEQTYDDYNKGQLNGDAKAYGQSRVCAYFGADFSWTISPNFRLYGLYAQNEYQAKGELSDGKGRGDTFPDSLGYQLGLDIKFPSKKGGFWIGAIEGIYTTPWLYVKHDADWSLYKARYDNLKNGSLPITSWVGTPFGPDSIACQTKFGYQFGKRWSVELQHLFLVQGENSFNLFYNEDGSTTANADGKYTYYPVAAFDNGVLTLEEAVNLARNRPTPTGIPEFTNRITLKGSYWFKNYLELMLQGSYIFIHNTDHIEGNFQQGLELAFSAKLSVLR